MCAQTYRTERINYKQNIADGLTIYTYKKKMHFMVTLYSILLYVKGFTG